MLNRVRAARPVRFILGKRFKDLLFTYSINEVLRRRLIYTLMMVTDRQIIATFDVYIFS